MARKISDETLEALLFQESRGDPNAVNEDSGAAGIAQIMPATALKPGFGIKPITLKQRFDPKIAVPFARKYMNAMLDRFDGNLATSLAAYNWGPGNVDKWVKSGSTFGRLPGETQNYVARILGNRGNAPPDPVVRGFLRREDDSVDLSGVSQDNLDDIGTLLDKQETRRLKEVKAAQSAANSALARRQAAFKRASSNRSSAPAPNFRPAASGGGGRGVPLAAATAAPVGVPGVDPVALQQNVFQGLLNPATSAGAGGLLAPTPPRRRV
jgi:hypothetical protein